MLSKTLRSLLILACAVFLPLSAQTTKPAPPGTANETMGTNPAAKSTTTATTTTTTTTTKTTKKAHHHLKAAPHGKAVVFRDATRLGALLSDTQGKAMLTPEAWKHIAREALALADRTYAASSGAARKEAKELRMHVREMHAAAMKGDADGAKSHAGMALPYVFKLIDWSAPAK